MPVRAWTSNTLLIERAQADKFSAVFALYTKYIKLLPGIYKGQGINSSFPVARLVIENNSLAKQSFYFFYI